MAVTIDPQFNLINSFLDQDYISVDEDFLPIDESKFFNQFQLIEDRNIVETIPVMEKFCGYNLIKTRQQFCIDIPKVTYTYDNGMIVKTIETIEIITGNSWIDEIKSFLGFEELKEKVEELKSVTNTFFTKIQKNGLDYTAKSDMTNTYVCNSLALMRGVGNLFLTIYNQAFFYPTYTEATTGYNIDGLYDGIPQQLIYPGLIQLIPNLPKEDCFITNYFFMLDNFLNQLVQFNSVATELDKVTFLTAYVTPPNLIDYNNPNITLSDLKAACLHHRTKIIELIDDKINLLNDCLSALETFDTILKLISTIAIVYNTSSEANNLQKVLLKGASENMPETQKAYDFAIDTKWAYSQAETAIGVMVATRKTLNFFNYHNSFEMVLDKIFEQGIKQYDKITT